VQQENPQAPAEHVDVVDPKPPRDEGQRIPINPAHAVAQEHPDLDGLVVVLGPLRQLFPLVDDPGVQV